ncbi:hypothetical protein AVEN_162553-1 [Araneus ventricosus]|uniref:Uncharacterized protein n=1 Tax=Araneus ventricosus TaxID=182803 RepID=A0A4Y2KVB7_ARAVE|nr:hypothetical protein AVEN_162553-1 [Araneus ventricosus]
MAEKCLLCEDCVVTDKCGSVCGTCHGICTNGAPLEEEEFQLDREVEESNEIYLRTSVKSVYAYFYVVLKRKIVTKVDASLETALSFIVLHQDKWLQFMTEQDEIKC